MEYINGPSIIAADLKERLLLGEEPIAGAAQHTEDLNAWVGFQSKHFVKSLLELGTGSGAFSLWLKSRYPNFLTIDNAYPYHDIEEFLLLDIFAEKKTIKKIIEKMERPFLLYCDNGDKPREVREFTDSLQRGDFLAVHDYCVEIKNTDIPHDYELITKRGLTAFFRKK